MTETNNLVIIEHATKVAVLEAKFEQMEADLQKISEKLDTLLDLKSKGMGAFWLVGLIFGSGVLGLLAFIGNLFKPSALG